MDLFFDIASYADDITPYIVENNIDNDNTSLEQVSDALFYWLKNNRLKNNVDKCHVLVSTNKPVGSKIGDYAIDNSECEKLLRVKIDVNLNFNDHIPDLCKKASRKISALARVTPFMRLSKRKLLKVQSCKLYNNKYTIASTQITNTENSVFIAVVIFKLLSRKVLFINRKDNRNLKSRLLFKNIADVTGELLQNHK